MEQKKNWLVWVLFVALCVIWGSSFKLMLIGLKGFNYNPYIVAGLRMLGAGMALLPFAIKSYKKLDRKQIALVALSGLIGSFLPAILFCMSETKIDPSFAGMLNSTTPIFVLLVGALFYRAKIPFIKWLGILVGLLGSVFLMWAYFSKKMVDPNYSVGNISFALCVIVATFLYGLNVNMVSKTLKDVDSIDIATIAFTSLIPLSLVMLFINGFLHADFTQAITINATIGSLFLGIIGTAIASILFYVLMKKAGFVFAALVTYGIPFVASTWGLLDGDTITILQMVGLVITLGGVFIANLQVKKKPDTTNTL